MPWRHYFLDWSDFESGFRVYSCGNADQELKELRSKRSCVESLKASGGPRETPIYQEVPTMIPGQVAAWFIYKEEEEGKTEEGTRKAH